MLIDGVRKALNNRGLTLEQARGTVHDRVELREFANRMLSKCVRENVHGT